LRRRSNAIAKLREKTPCSFAGSAGLREISREIRTQELCARFPCGKAHTGGGDARCCYTHSNTTDNAHSRRCHCLRTERGTACDTCDEPHDEHNQTDDAKEYEDGRDHAPNTEARNSDDTAGRGRLCERC
jgi:hypothetical protein